LKIDCVRKLLEEAAALPPNVPLILCGDLNAPPEAPLLRRLTAGGFVDALAAANPEANGATMPSQEPEARLDYVLLREGCPVGVRSVEVIGDEPDGDGFYGSDHLGVRADLFLSHSDAP
jgi:endonuclease/exonuclease/phosphatase family metal-dependent hydrolase